MNNLETLQNLPKLLDVQIASRVARRTLYDYPELLYNGISPNLGDIKNPNWRAWHQAYDQFKQNNQLTGDFPSTVSVAEILLHQVAEIPKQELHYSLQARKVAYASTALIEATLENTLEPVQDPQEWVRNKRLLVRYTKQRFGKDPDRWPTLAQEAITLLNERTYAVLPSLTDMHVSQMEHFADATKSSFTSSLRRMMNQALSHESGLRPGTTARLNRDLYEMSPTFLHDQFQSAISLYGHPENFNFLQSVRKKLADVEATEGFRPQFALSLLRLASYQTTTTEVLGTLEQMHQYFFTQMELANVVTAPSPEHWSLPDGASAVEYFSNFNKLNFSKMELFFWDLFNDFMLKHLSAEEMALDLAAQVGRQTSLKSQIESFYGVAHALEAQQQRVEHRLPEQIDYQKIESLELSFNEKEFLCLYAFQAQNTLDFIMSELAKREQIAANEMVATQLTRYKARLTQFTQLLLKHIQEKDLIQEKPLSMIKMEIRAHIIPILGLDPDIKTNIGEHIAKKIDTLDMRTAQDTVRTLKEQSIGLIPQYDQRTESIFYTEALGFFTNGSEEMQIIKTCITDPTCDKINRIQLFYSLIELMLNLRAASFIAPNGPDDKPQHVLINAYRMIGGTLDAVFETDEGQELMNIFLAAKNERFKNPAHKSAAD